jgi:hypothetical protein
MNKRVILSAAASACALLAAHSALAGSHTWRISEVFSTPDGLIQFIELRESLAGAGEINLGPTMSVSTGHSINGSVLTPPTTNRHILIATQSFADLPGAPTPDYIIDPLEIPFFNQLGDTVAHSNWDSWTFGAVPTDCVSSLHKGLPPGEVVTTELNSPTNYAGVTGSINACPVVCPADIDNSSSVDVDDLVAVILGWGECPAKAPCPADVDDSGTVDVDDLVAVILGWGPCA